MNKTIYKVIFITAAIILIGDIFFNVLNESFKKVVFFIILLLAIILKYSEIKEHNFLEQFKSINKTKLLLFGIGAFLTKSKK
ncbi:hypothetical protein MHJ94_07545 [Chryseobacterium taklimakanense]|uniref:hypothetical protein n=1 Tax=Chryseobacterium taklimakanense TaxID=536441 RepID=UPI001EF4D7E1|nr:hypothetical protein [Chryseobacterium taklimakanense]MCG7281151.1 hypothetical protein [Chryseobacterium taklimakanense]